MTPRRPWTLQRKLIVTVVSITSFIMVLVGAATSAILGNVLEAGLTDQVANAANTTASTVQRQLASGMTAEQILEERPQQPGFLLVVRGPSAAAQLRSPVRMALAASWPLWTADSMVAGRPVRTQSPAM